MGTTSAYGYHEEWTGWFSWGTLYYEDNAYTCSAEGGRAYDSTAGTVDSFYCPPSSGLIAGFVCEEIDDTIWLTVLGSTFTGSKPTDESGTKEVDDGAWSGSALRTGYGHDPQRFSLVEGTWDTNGETEYFDYTDYPREDPTYSAGWDVSRSIPSGITGAGGSSGYRSDRW